MEDILARIKRSYRLLPLISLVLFLVLFTTLSISELVSYVTTKNLIIEEVQRGHRTTLKLFTDHIAKDLKFGLKSEVYRKCEALFKDPSVSALSVVTFRNEKVCDFKKGWDERDIKLEGSVFFGLTGNNEIATIYISFNSSYLESIKYRSIQLAAALLLFNIVCLSFFFRKSLKRLLLPIESLAETLSTADVGNINEFVKTRSSHVLEIDNFYRAIEKMSFQIEWSEKDKLRRIKEKSLYDQASQIVHDLRNPILRLKLKINNNIESIELKNKLQKDIQFLEDLTSSMLQRYRSGKVSSINNKSAPLEMISSLNRLVEEWRTEFSEINLSFDNETEFENIFVNISRNSISRIFSNLIRNSIDAIKCGEGIISLKISVQGQNVSVELIDNGCGVPIGVIDQIAGEGFSYNKEEGNGIGLFYCKTEVEKHHGQFSVESILGEYTKVTVSLPIVRVPIWATKSLYFNDKTRLFILDDDKDIHSYWKQLYEREDLKRIGVKFHHFSSIAEFEDFFEERPVKDSDQFLLDYDLKEVDSRKGIELISKYGLEGVSTILSNHFDDEQLLEKCERSAVRLYPKQSIEDLLLNYLPNYWNTEKVKIVLVDDDKEILSSLKAMLSQYGHEVLCYRSYSQVIEDIKHFDRETFFLVDLNLGGFEDGLFTTRELYSAGFNKQFLFTGEELDARDYFWICKVISKESPKDIIEIFFDVTDTCLLE